MKPHKYLTLIILLSLSTFNLYAQVHGRSGETIRRNMFELKNPKIASRQTHLEIDGAVKWLYHNIYIPTQDKDSVWHEFVYYDDGTYEIRKFLKKDDSRLTLFERKVDLLTVIDSLNSQLQGYMNGNFSFNDINAQFLKVGESTWQNIFIDRIKMDSLVLNYNTTDLTSLHTVKVKKLTLNNCKVSSRLQLDSVFVSDTLSIINSDLPSDIDFSYLAAPTYLSLAGSTFNKGGLVLDLTRLMFGKRKCLINLYQTDISGLRLNYVNFRLAFPKGITIEEKLNIYQRLLSKFKSDGYEESYKELDIEYQEFKYLYVLKSPFRNWIDKWWWLYGYQKSNIFWIGLAATLIFFVGNFFNYEDLVKDVYHIKSFGKNYDEIQRKRLSNPIKYQVLKAMDALIYTGYLFWGIKLDIEKLNVNFRLLSIYVILQYITGLIFVAYIANIIITK